MTNSNEELDDHHRCWAVCVRIQCDLCTLDIFFFLYLEGQIPFTWEAKIKSVTECSSNHFPALLLKDQAFNEQFVKTTLLSAECSSTANKRQESELWILIFYNHLPGTSEQGFSIFSAFFESSLPSRDSLGVSVMVTLAVLIGFTSVENPLVAALRENFL